MSSAIPQQKKHLYEFGSFLLDPAERILARAQERISLAPKTFDTLLVLVQHSGHVLSKDELMKAVWPDSFVEENNLTQNISALRKAMGEEVGSQEYIETVPRLGYRFVMPVRMVTAETRSLTFAPAIPARTPATESVAQSPVPSATTGVQPADTQPLIPSRPFWLTLRGLLLLFSLTAVLALGISLYLWKQPRASGGLFLVPTPTRQTVAVLGFRNLGGNHDDDWLSTAFSEMLTTEMAAGNRLRTVSGEDITRMKHDMNLADVEGLSKTTLSMVRTSVGADFTISGSYIKLGNGTSGKIRLDLQLQDTEKGETVGSDAEVGTVSELFELVSRSGTKLRTKLGAPIPSSSQEGEFRAAVPSNVEAAQYYSEGLAKLRAFDAPAAQVLLTRTVTADPNFPLGHSALAAAWSALGYDEKAKAEAKRALDLSTGMSREDRLLVAGGFYEITHDWDKAVETYKLLANFFPDNLDYGLRLAGVQTSAGKGSEALSTVDKLRKLPSPVSSDPQIDLAEAFAAESLGDFKRERQVSETAAQKGEALGEHLFVARARFKEGWALLRLGEPEDALEVLNQANVLFTASGDKQGAASTLRVISYVLFNQGEYERAKQKGREAVEIFSQIGDRAGMAKSLNTIAVVHLEQGELESAKALFEQSLQIQREVASKINIAGALGNIAEVLDAEGNISEAQRLTEESIKVFVEVGDQRALATALGNRADLLLERGDLAGAKASYEDSFRTAKNIGYQRGVAFSLSGLSQVLALQGDLLNARKQEQEALEIRQRIGEKHNAAVSQVRLAELSFEDGKSSDSSNALAQSIQQFNADKSSADEALAQAILARQFGAENKIKEAQAALQTATELARSSSRRPLRFELDLAAAYIALKNRPDRGSLERARKMLSRSKEEAQILGYPGYELKLGLALAEMEIAIGKFHAAYQLLENLEKAAQSKGFSQIAKRAETILSATCTEKH